MENTKSTTKTEKTETTNLIVGKNRKQPTFIINNKAGLLELMRNHLGFGENFNLGRRYDIDYLDATYQKDGTGWRKSVDNIYTSIKRNPKDSSEAHREKMDKEELKTAQYIRVETNGYSNNVWSRIKLGTQYTLSQLEGKVRNGYEGKLGKFLSGYENKVRTEEQKSLTETFADSAEEIFTKIIKDKLEIITPKDINAKVKEELLKTDFEKLVKEEEKLEDKHNNLWNKIDYEKMDKFLENKGLEKFKNYNEFTNEEKLQYPAWKEKENTREKLNARREEIQELITMIKKGVYATQKGIENKEYLADISRGFDVTKQGDGTLTGSFSVDVYDLVYGKRFYDTTDRSNDKTLEDVRNYTKWDTKGFASDNLVMTIEFSFNIVKFDKNAHIENLSLQINQPVKTQRYSDDKEVLSFELEDLLTSDNSKFEKLLEEVYAVRKKRNVFNQLQGYWQEEFTKGHISPHNLVGKVMITPKQS